MKKLGIFLFSIAVMTGCAGNQNAGNQYGVDENRDGTRFISNNGLESDRVNDTRDHTMDEQNPNFINFEGNRVNNQQDVNQARQVIRAMGDLRPGPIWINGDDIRVTAYKKGAMSDQERVDEEARLHKKLIQALPRYNVEVKVQEDRTE